MAQWRDLQDMRKRRRPVEEQHAAALVAAVHDRKAFDEAVNHLERRRLTYMQLRDVAERFVGHAVKGQTKLDVLAIIWFVGHSRRVGLTKLSTQWLGRVGEHEDDHD